MARIVPSDISRLALSGGHTHELETLQQLKAQLPEDYTVFHGVHWSREYAAWTHFGEIDFVVLNRSGDVLFIEQKNGSLEESAAGLVKRYGQSEKNVADQIHRSVDKVREKYKWQNGGAQPLVVDYLIYCPDYRVKQLNAAGLNSERVVDAAARDGLAGRIQTILGPGVIKPRRPIRSGRGILLPDLRSGSGYPRTYRFAGKTVRPPEWGAGGYPDPSGDGAVSAPGCGYGRERQEPVRPPIPGP